MKHSLLFIFIYLIATGLVVAQNTERSFEYPTPPDELETLSERTGYLVEHFWDRCNLSSEILNRQRFTNAFTDYVSFMPYADANVVHESVNKLISAYAKSPEHLLTLAEIAEEILYDSTAEFQSDEVYLPFAQAVANNKKLSKSQKARFVHQAAILSGTQVGMIAPDLKLIDRNGDNHSLSEFFNRHTLLFINDPDCEDCMLARVRLSADHNINSLIDDGFLNVISIYPDKFTEEWQKSVANYNSRWIVAASEDVDNLFDLRNPPVLYYLNADGKILSKNLAVENLLQAFKVANEKVSR